MIQTLEILQYLLVLPVFLLIINSLQTQTWNDEKKKNGKIRKVLRLNKLKMNGWFIHDLLKNSSRPWYLVGHGFYRVFYSKTIKSIKKEKRKRKSTDYRTTHINMNIEKP